MRSFNVSASASRIFWARVARITRLDGVVLRIAEAEASITVGAETFTPLPGCSIGSVKHIINGEMPSSQIDFAHSSGGVIDTAKLNAGAWDAATVQIYIIDRRNITTLGDPLFTGTIQPVTIDPMGGRGSFDLRGLAAQASTVTQNYQAMCRIDLFSPLCQLSGPSFAVSATIATIVDRFTVTVTGPSNPTGWFNQGIGDAANGFKFEIADWVLSTLTLRTYLPICIARFSVGLGLTLYPGCDKTAATCKTKFNNKINFQGEDHFLGVNSTVGV